LCWDVLVVVELEQALVVVLAQLPQALVLMSVRHALSFDVISWCLAQRLSRLKVVLLSLFGAQSCVALSLAQEQARAQVARPHPLCLLDSMERLQSLAQIF
jgi:hypothetical protein